MPPSKPGASTPHSKEKPTSTSPQGHRKEKPTATNPQGHSREDPTASIPHGHSKEKSTRGKKRTRLIWSLIGAAVALLGVWLAQEEQRVLIPYLPLPDNLSEVSLQVATRLSEFYALQLESFSSFSLPDTSGLLPGWFGDEEEEREAGNQTRKEKGAPPINVMVEAAERLVAQLRGLAGGTPGAETPLKDAADTGGSAGQQSTWIRPGKQLAAQGMKPKHPVLIIPGFVTSQLELWKGKPCAERLFRQRMWGTLGMMQQFLRDSACWFQHLELDVETGLDPEGIKLRAASGLEAVDMFVQGYWVWGKLVEALADVGYDTNNIATAPFDWRLAVTLLQERDAWFTRTRFTIESLVATSGHKVVMLSHSFGESVARTFMSWADDREPGWVEANLHAHVEIAGPTLGVPKALSAILSGEMRDTAQLGALAGYLTNSLVPRPARAKLFRSWASVLAMLPAGGPKIWGNATWAPDDTDHMRAAGRSYGAMITSGPLDTNVTTTSIIKNSSAVAANITRAGNNTSTPAGNITNTSSTASAISTVPADTANASTTAAAAATATTTAAGMLTSNTTDQITADPIPADPSNASDTADANTSTADTSTFLTGSINASVTADTTNATATKTIAADTISTANASGAADAVENAVVDATTASNTAHAATATPPSTNSTASAVNSTGARQGNTSMACSWTGQGNTTETCSLSGTGAAQGNDSTTSEADSAGAVHDNDSTSAADGYSILPASLLSWFASSDEKVTQLRLQLASRAVHRMDIRQAIHLSLTEAGGAMMHQHYKSWGPTHGPRVTMDPTPDNRVDLGLSEVKEEESEEATASDSQAAKDLQPMLPNPLLTPLPNAPSMRIFCFYGTGIPTERSYHYQQPSGWSPDSLKASAHPLSEQEISGVQGEPWKDQSPAATPPSHGWKIQTGLHDPESELLSGIQMSPDGDLTVPLLSLGGLCRGGWLGKRLNPAGLKVLTREYLHKPCSLLTDSRGGPAASAHVDILGNEELLTDVLRVATGAGDLVEERIVSRIDQITAQIDWENPDGWT